MAGQSITFDFLSRGSATVAGDFRKVGDNAALASRGAKVLADVIGKLGDKEDRTAAQSKILAAALRQTGQDEDRVTARAVLADAAIRRLGDAMQDSSKKSDGLGKTLKGLSINPGLAGPALLLAPAMTTLAGVAAGAGVALGGAFVAGAAALGAFGAVAKPVLTSALTASKAVSTAQATYNAAIKAGVPTAQAQATLQAANASAQLTYTAALKGGAKPAAALAAYHLALAKNQLAYNKATNAGVFTGKAYAAEQAAISKAYAGMSPQQIALSKQLGAMSDAWAKVKAAQTPVIAGALQPWLQSVTSLTKQLGPIIQAVSPVIGALGAQFGAIITSTAFTAFRDFIANTGSRAVGAAGNALLGLFQAFIIILPKFTPLIQGAITWLGNLGPAIEKWASSKKTAADITAFMGWFTKNGPQVETLLTNLGGALKALAPGLTSGGALELKIISDFLGFVAKLPPAIAKPLAEVAGAALILSKMGGTKVIRFLVTGTLGGIFGKGGATAGAAGAEGAAAGGLVGRLLGAGARLVGGLFVVDVAMRIATSFLPAATPAAAKAATTGTPAPVQNIFNAILGQGGAQTFEADIARLQNNWRRIMETGWQHIAGDAKDSWNTLWSNTITGAVIDGKLLGRTVTGAWSSIAGGAKTWWGGITSTIGGAWDKLTGHSRTTTAGIAGQFTHMSSVIATAMQQSGRAADALRTRNLTPLLGAAGQVSGGIQGLASRINPGLSGSLNAGGAHVNSFRSNNLGPLQGSLSRTSGGVQGLQGLINAMHGKTVNVGVHASGSGGMSFTQKVAGAISSGGFSLLSLKAAGGTVTGGVPGRDSVPILATPGEVVVPAPMVKAGAVDHLRGRLPGFASGGIVGMPTWAGGKEYDFARAWETGFLSAGLAALKKAVAARAAAQAAATAKAGLGNLPLGNGPLSGSAAIAQAFARSILWAYGWGQSQFPPLQALWNQESGWNAYAVNKSSGAYGIPQSLGHGHPYNLGDYQAQIRWGLAYISSRYGSPSGAWAHEVANNWYDNGGWLMPGTTIAHNNTGRPEQVIPAGRGGGGKLEVTLSFDRSVTQELSPSQLRAIRAAVHHHGGGNVQTAFGRR